MVNSALVKIWDTLVGGIVWDASNGIVLFEYDDDFLKKGWDIAPIMMPTENAKGKVFSFPEHRDNALFKGLPGLLADVLPDRYGKMLINAWLSENGRPLNDMNPIELLCYIGKRGMGALEFEPAIPEDSGKSTKVEISQLIEITNKILASRSEFNTNLSKGDQKALYDILKIGASAGGARAKAVIAYNEQTGDITSGQAFAPKGYRHWLIKFDGVVDKQFGASYGFGRVEMAYHLMAKDSGIEMTECQLLEENDRAHFMTRRFDRTEDNQKLHVQTFCALQHFDFNDINIFSYEQLFSTMRMLRLDYSQAEQLYRRMVFNVLSRNCDDHTKNFSFLMDKTGTWKLAPAYDLCFAYSPNSAWVSHQALSVNSKRQNITTDDFMEVAKQMNIKKAKQIIEQVEDVVQDWRVYAQKTNVMPEYITTIENELKNRLK